MMKPPSSGFFACWRENVLMAVVACSPEPAQMTSTPTIKGFSRIDQAFAAADRRPCHPSSRWPGEVLEYIPGMIVTQHSGAGKANQYFLRGFNLDHGTDFDTYVAGMPVNMRTHAHESRTFRLGLLYNF